MKSFLVSLIAASLLLSCASSGAWLEKNRGAASIAIGGVWYGMGLGSVEFNQDQNSVIGVAGHYLVRGVVNGNRLYLALSKNLMEEDGSAILTLSGENLTGGRASGLMDNPAGGTPLVLRRVPDARMTPDQIKPYRYAFTKKAGAPDLPIARHWLMTKRGKAAVNVTGAWESAEWGPVTLTQKDDLVYGTWGSFTVEGVTNGGRIYCIFMSRGFAWYTGVLELKGNQLAGKSSTWVDFDDQFTFSNPRPMSAVKKEK